MPASLRIGIILALIISSLIVALAACGDSGPSTARRFRARHPDRNRHARTDRHADSNRHANVDGHARTDRHADSNRHANVRRPLPNRRPRRRQPLRPEPTATPAPTATPTATPKAFAPIDEREFPGAPRRAASHCRNLLHRLPSLRAIRRRGFVLRRIQLLQGRPRHRHILILTYDSEAYSNETYGGACALQLTFETETTGISSYVCSDGIKSHENWRVTDRTEKPVPPPGIDPFTSEITGCSRATDSSGQATAMIEGEVSATRAVSVISLVVSGEANGQPLSSRSFGQSPWYEGEIREFQPGRDRRRVHRLRRVRRSVGLDVGGMTTGLSRRRP